MQERSEALRKLLHAGGGFLPPVFVLAFGWSGAVAIAIFLLAYFALAWQSLRAGRLVPIAAAFIHRTSRNGSDAAEAAFEFLLAILVLGLLLPLPYFFASIALLGVGDTAASIVGRRWGRKRLPWNPQKSWVGLLAGLLFGIPAYVAFAIIGGQMMSAGWQEAQGIFGSPPSWLALAFIIVAFTLLHGVAAWGAKAGTWPRHANVKASQTLLHFLIAFTAAAAYLLLMPGTIAGPLLPTQGGHGSTLRGLLILAPVAGMLAETFCRRHDNLVVPGVAAGVAYGLVALANRL